MTASIPWVCCSWIICCLPSPSSAHIPVSVTLLSLLHIPSPLLYALTIQSPSNHRIPPVPHVRPLACRVLIHLPEERARVRDRISRSVGLLHLWKMPLLLLRRRGPILLDMGIVAHPLRRKRARRKRGAVVLPGGLAGVVGEVVAGKQEGVLVVSGASVEVARIEQSI